MIPPCDPLILERNPNFQKLHLHLTTNLLNPDASTRAVEELSERKAVADELKALQIRSAKRKILLQALRLACTADSIDGRDDDSSNGVRETTAIIAMFLDATSGPNVRDNATLESLLGRDIQHFLERCMRILIPYISDTLSSWTDDLRSLVDTTVGNPASTTTISKSKVTTTTTTTTTQPRSRIKSRLSIAKPPTLPRLSTQIEQRLSRLHQLQTLELPTMRNKAAATAASLIAARGDVIERTIVLLERTKHGSLSRATKARADYLATVAECISAKVQVTNLECLSTIYTPENVAALGNYDTHLRETLEQLKRTQRIANQTLEEYDRVGSTTAAKKSRSGPPMADIARRYGDLVHEVEVVRKDIQKLRSENST